MLGMLWARVEGFPMLVRQHKTSLAPVLSPFRKLFSSSSSALPCVASVGQSNRPFLTQYSTTMARFPSQQQSRPVHATPFTNHANPR